MEATMTTAASAQIEYAIYTFDKNDAKAKGDSKWQKHATLSDMVKAMSEAQSLLESKKFERIEVKKKFFDQKKNRTVDMTLKVFESEPQKDYGTIIAVAIALFCGVGAFALSFLLTQ